MTVTIKFKHENHVLKIERNESLKVSIEIDFSGPRDAIIKN